MAIGTLIGGLATLAVGPLGAAIGAITAAAVAVAMEFAQTRGATRWDRGDTIRDAAISGGSVAIALFYWWLLRR